jgi:hypothetical protein
VNGRLHDWRTALKECVALEKAIYYLELVRKWHESGRVTVPLVDVIEIWIPCILYCENHVGEKNITILLRRQLDKYNGPKMNFIDAMDNTFQTKVLGSMTSPPHWRLKHSKNAEGQIQIDPLQVRNQTARKMVQKIDVIAEDAVSDGDHAFKAKVVSAVGSYREAMKLLMMHRSLVNEKKKQFQDLIEDFYLQWIELFGEEGITNYIHLLGSGHMLYFLEWYNCLYIYS